MRIFKHFVDAGDPANGARNARRLVAESKVDAWSFRLPQSITALSLP